jgi:hypothetical protein
MPSAADHENNNVIDAGGFVGPRDLGTADQLPGAAPDSAERWAFRIAGKTSAFDIGRQNVLKVMWVRICAVRNSRKRTRARSPLVATTAGKVAEFVRDKGVRS